MIRRIIIAATILAASTVFLQPCYAQGWQLGGPDSSHWRYIYQVDGAFQRGSAPRIAAATSMGIVSHFGDKWRYPLRNYVIQNITFLASGFYEKAYFSPWSDSVGFSKVRGISGETLYDVFFKVNNLYANPPWEKIFF